MVRLEDIAIMAERVCVHFGQTHDVLHVDRISFAWEAGRCAEFVREVHEAVLGTGDHTWPYRAGNARECELNLIADSMRRPRPPERGQVVCFNAASSGKNGHIAIWLGDDYIAENTSSKVRGPGTVRSNMTGDLWRRMTGVYQGIPPEFLIGAEPRPLSVHYVSGTMDKVIECGAKEENEVTRCNLRMLAEGMGYEVRYDEVGNSIRIKRRVDD